MQRDTELAEMLSDEYDCRLSISEAPPRYSQVVVESFVPLPSPEEARHPKEAWDADRIAEYQGISQGYTATDTRIPEYAGDSSSHPRAAGGRKRKPIRAQKHEKALRWLASRRRLGSR